MSDRKLKSVLPRPAKSRVVAMLSLAALLAALGGQVAYGSRLGQLPAPATGATDLMAPEPTAPAERPMPAHRRATVNDPNCEQPSAEASLKELDGLAQAVAKASGGQARRTVVDQQCFRDRLQSRSVVVLVGLPTGEHFEVRVDLAGSSAGEGTNAGWNCAFAASDKIDNKPCTQYSISARQSLTSSTVDDFEKGGRASLDYSALTLSEAELSVHVDNYAELRSGQKVVGPNWHQVGYTPAKLRDIVNGSGLLG